MNKNFKVTVTDYRVGEILETNGNNLARAILELAYATDCIHELQNELRKTSLLQINV